MNVEPRLAIAAALFSASLLQPSAPQFSLRDLAIDSASLRTPCRLAPAPSRPANGTRVVTGLWAGLPIRTNPWIGTDASILSAIRMRMGAALTSPDGPPLTPAQNTRYLSHLADGVAEGFAAIYDDGGTDVTAVYALRFIDPSGAGEFAASLRGKGSAPLVIRGDVVARVVGGGSGCAAQLATHLGALVGK